MNKNAQKHPFAPVFDEKSKVLILGSFPSESSEEAGFYYGDTGNRFWNTLGEVFQTPNLADKSVADKKSFLLEKKIALWDIWAYCYKKDGSKKADDELIEIEPDSEKVDLTELFKKAKEIQVVFTTIGGSENSTKPRNKHKQFKEWGIEEWLKKYGKSVIPLYSTSNQSRRAGISDEVLLNDYKQIKEVVEG